MRYNKTKKMINHYVTVNLLSRGASPFEGGTLQGSRCVCVCVCDWGVGGVQVASVTYNIGKVLYYPGCAIHCCMNQTMQSSVNPDSTEAWSVSHRDQVGNRLIADPLGPLITGTPSCSKYRRLPSLGHVVGNKLECFYIHTM